MILVTGGTGLIGAHLLFYLTQNEENKIRAIYRSESSLKKVKEVFSAVLRRRREILSSNRMAESRYKQHFGT